MAGVDALSHRLDVADRPCWAMALGQASKQAMVGAGGCPACGLRPDLYLLGTGQAVLWRSRSRCDRQMPI